MLHNIRKPSLQVGKKSDLFQGRTSSKGSSAMAESESAKGKEKWLYCVGRFLISISGV